MAVVEVRVQAHPSRSKMAERLAAELHGSVVFDPSPDASLRSPWRTYRACLERPICTRTTHLLVIQDDARPCDHLEGVLSAVAGARDGLVTLYVGGMPRVAASCVERACNVFESFALIPATQWVPTVALIWPVELIARALAWVDEQHWRTMHTADDEVVGRIARGLQVPVWASVPSLVDHPDEVVSIVGNRRPESGRNPWRCAHVLIDPGCDVREYDW